MSCVSVPGVPMPQHTAHSGLSQTQLREKLLWPSPCSTLSTIAGWFTPCLSPSQSLGRGIIPGHAQGNVTPNVTSSARQPKRLSLPNKFPRWMQSRRGATALSSPHSEWFVTWECRAEQAQQELREGNMPWAPRSTVLLHSVLYLCKQLLGFRAEYFTTIRGKEARQTYSKISRNLKQMPLPDPQPQFPLFRCPVWNVPWARHSGAPVLGLRAHICTHLSAVQDLCAGQGLGRPGKSCQQLWEGLLSLLTILEVLDKNDFHLLKTSNTPPPFFFYRTYSVFMKSSHKIFVSPKIRHLSLKESKTFLFQRTSAFQIKDTTVLCDALCRTSPPSH